MGSSRAVHVGFWWWLLVFFFFTVWIKQCCRWPQELCFSCQLQEGWIVLRILLVDVCLICLSNMFFKIVLWDVVSWHNSLLLKVKVLTLGTYYYCFLYIISDACQVFLTQFTEGTANLVGKAGWWPAISWNTIGLVKIVTTDLKKRMIPWGFWNHIHKSLK